jgi:peptide deformylase
MALRNILLHPDPRLKKKCEPVDTIDDATRVLMQDMLETMYHAPGVGLAAPQIGILKRILVMDVVKDEDAEPQPYLMANPEVTWASETLSINEEGCLSIPDEFADVQRPSEVRVRYLDQNGETQEIECDGLLATCVQHEIDHLDGKLFIDYLGPVKRSMITGRMKKRKKERATV